MKILTLTVWLVLCTCFAPIGYSQDKLYFGKKYEPATHVGMHFAISLWRLDYSLVSAISIETAQTISGRFEAEDWGYRIGGALVGYLAKKKYEDLRKSKHKKDFWFTTAGSIFIGSVMYRGGGFENRQTRITFDVARLIVGSVLIYLITNLKE